MNVHRVRRLAETLVASQFRSGRTGSDPRSLIGRPGFLAFVDAAAFLFAFGAVGWFLRGGFLTPVEVSGLARVGLPFVPLLAVGAVVLAGVLFELTTGARFGGSDAANWLPITPTEYVTASASAIAYSYSTVIALTLGGLAPVAIAAGQLPEFVLTALLAAVGLFEGGVLIEMVRAAAQRAGGTGVARQGRFGLLVRLGLLVALILVLDLSLNPIFLFGFLQGFSSYLGLTQLVPVFWGTQSLVAWGQGAGAEGVAFAVGQVAFVALLTYLASLLRARYWVPSAGDVAISVGPVRSGHPVLAALGLSSPEAALVSKDLRGLLRRREMAPTLAVPIVLLVLGLIEVRAAGSLVALAYAGWISGFFALLLSVRAVGQERRAFALLYAYPITALEVRRAKAASVLLPAVAGAVAITAIVGVVEHLALATIVGFGAVNVTDAGVLGIWGLVFASRFSDFQERPRPQDLRPGATLAALGSGMALLFPTLVPVTVALVGLEAPLRPWLLLWAFGFAAAALLLGLRWSRTGFEALLREVPF